MNIHSSSPWERAASVLAAAMWGASIICLLVLLGLLSLGILVRFVPVISVGWMDEIVEFAFAWMVFLGTAVLWRENAHISVSFLPEMLAGTRAGRVLEVCLALLSMVFLVVFTWQGWLLTLQAVGNRTPIFELPRAAWYVAVPVSGVVMIGYTLRRGLQAVRSARSDERNDAQG